MMINKSLGCEYMKASEEGASRYLEEAMINELIEKHLAQGYSVLNSSSLLSDVQPDLALEKDGKKLLIEVVVRGTRESEQAEKILRIHKALQTIKNAEFKTVFVNIPKRVEVTIEGIEGGVLVTPAAFRAPPDSSFVSAMMSVSCLATAPP